METLGHLTSIDGQVLNTEEFIHYTLYDVKVLARAKTKGKRFKIKLSISSIISRKT